ncbi:hypothetical protein LGN04_25825 [Burkholderia multivorans]|uniref:hypothetical protein n=1 Tax=Burkholderia multivorans TaxID=87883 RepID=UPI000D00A361|nr:hypothetical protein [Burkholderia multivorans]MBU9312540.1 hypothetical protein [Burkholderia multivorans]MCA8250714.1 hypothetical protein [Burkholderia multivorans]MCA8457331.1 hypothetical protein [Burkholderia multivorans]MDN7870387.1 hypothetical protein [Burkholderia multivorans]PRH24444.1 hypothetical protein C6T53_17870 [Burkholderia multivorans]
MSTLYSRLLDEPAALVGACYDEAFRLTPQQILDIQLSGARRRFADLRARIPVLDRLGSEQGIDDIQRLDDVAPLLFAHTVYKSYPMSYLERGQFDRLTRWLNGLTAEDISHVDASGIKLIDDWIDLLDAQTNLRVFHTSGTTGKLSFLPRTDREWRQNIALSANRIRDWRGPGSGPDLLAEQRPLIAPAYRLGASAAARGGGYQVEMYAGGEENALFMYPDARFSADVASLSGRLSAAEAQGELGALQISPALLARRDELVRVERERPEQLRRFFAEAIRRFGGKDVYIGAVWSILYDTATEGLARGARGVFGERSVLHTGGGKKGKNMPDNWRDQLVEFLGFDNFYEFYGCSEQMGFCMRCEEGHYHVPPTTIAFLLDPATGKPLPRKDGLTGRFASLDLLPSTYWAGLVTGDEITMCGLEKPCRCGRSGAYLLPAIRRYTEKEGGDDKVICAGAPAAHDEALNFLTELSE